MDNELKNFLVIICFEFKFAGMQCFKFVRDSGRMRNCFAPTNQESAMRSLGARSIIVSLKNAVSRCIVLWSDLFQLSSAFITILLSPIDY